MPEGRKEQAAGPNAALFALAVGRVRKGDFGSLSPAERLFVRQCVAHKAADYREKAEMAAAVVERIGPVPAGFPRAALQLRDDLVAIGQAYREAAAFAERVAAGGVALNRRTNRRACILERNIAAVQERIARTTMRQMLADLDLSTIAAAGSA